MKKRIIYGIILGVIIVGAIIIATMGLNADLTYSKNVKVDIYVGKTIENNDIKQNVKEVFGRKNYCTTSRSIWRYGNSFNRRKKCR